MTQSDRMEVLRQAVAEHGQAEVARRIGRSSSALSQILSGKYAGEPGAILELVEAAFSDSNVMCPVLGDVPLATCIEERRKPFFPSSSQRIVLWRACQVCKHKEGVK